MRRLVVLSALALVAGCSGSDGGDGTPDTGADVADVGGGDASTDGGEDTGGEDTGGEDTGGEDTGGEDTGADTGCPDDDDDGVCNDDDICADGDDGVDEDDDGTPDACDPCPADDPDDSDDDGVCDSEDVCADGDDGDDADEDGVPDACDVCPDGDDGDDMDGDGVPDACDVCEGGDDTMDADEDGVPNFCDECADAADGDDADEDGVADACDICPDGDDTVDTDEDGVPDDCDVCDGGDDTMDADGDDVPDACDVCADGDDNADEDEDGVADACDACPGEDDRLDDDEDTVPDACDVCAGGDDLADLDEDDVPDACDNCPDIENPDQLDTDAALELTAESVDFALRESPVNTVELDDDDVAVVELDPAFAYGGETFDAFSISSNGFILPGAWPTSADGCCAGIEFGLPLFEWDGESEIGELTGPYPGMIAAFHGDLDPSDGGRVGWEVRGESPERELIVAFEAVPSWGAGVDDPQVSFQIIVSETGFTEVHCANCTPIDGTPMSQGIVSLTDGDIYATLDGRNAASGWSAVEDGVRFDFAVLEGDGAGDACDLCPDDYYDDVDEDGVCDSDDLCADADDTEDADEDTIPDACDVCPGGDDTEDADEDGVPDDCDTCDAGDDTIDSDEDTVPDACDVCPFGDDTVDTDGDDVPDDCDVCPGEDDRLDADGDDVPDACDACAGEDDRLDADGDDVPDACDACPGEDDRLDADGDDVPDACDECADGDDGLDADGDDVPDACDICAEGDDGIDTDGDDVPDACDLCEGVDDAIDFDDDTIPDACDNCPFDANEDQADTDIWWEVSAEPVAFGMRALTGSTLELGDDDVAQITPGFDLTWFGETFDTLSVSSNGFVTFGTNEDNACCVGGLLGGVQFREDREFGGGRTPFAGMIAGYWEDLNPGSGGTIRWDVSGAAPERVVVIEFSEVPHFPDTDPVTFQIAIGEEGWAEVHCETCVPSDDDPITQGVTSVDDPRVFAAIDGRNGEAGWSAIEDAVRFEPVQFTGDGVGDVCDACDSGDDTADADGDDVPDACDNCPSDANADQANDETEGYGARGIEFDWYDFEAEGTIRGDDNTTAVTLPFTFSYFDTDETEVQVGTNGYIAFGATARNFNPPELGDTRTPHGMIAAYSADWNPNDGGEISWGTLGTEGERVFVVQYEDVPEFGDYSFVSETTFQIALHEGSNEIEIFCMSCASSGQTYRQGVENQDSTVAIVFDDRNGDDFALAYDGVRFQTNSGDPLDDGYGDACDVCAGGDDRDDTDGDGVPDACDLCPFGADDEDVDGDGTPDACDSCLLGADYLDTDGNGSIDACETREAQPGDLVVTEVMQNPAAVADSAGEWFEVTNVSGFGIEWTSPIVLDGGSDRTGFGDTSVISIPAGGRALLANTSDPLVNGGIEPDAAWDDMFLGNSADEIYLESEAGTEIGGIEYDGGPVWPDPNGASMTFGGDPYLDDTNDGSNWCTATEAYGDGDLGSPGEANELCWTCGDGVREGSEECDDGNLDERDGCTSTCRWDSTRACVDGGTDIGWDDDESGTISGDDMSPSSCGAADEVFDYVTIIAPNSTETGRITRTDGGDGTITVAVRFDGCEGEEVACRTLASGDSLTVTPGSRRDTFYILAESATDGTPVSFAYTFAAAD